MPDGNLGQDDIDSLVASLGGGDPKPASPAPAPAAAPAAPAAAAPAAPASGSGTSASLDQLQIDALVQQASETAKAPTGAVASSTAQGQLGQAEIDKLLAELDPQTRGHSVSGSAAAHLSQDDIDKLLGDLDVPGGGEDSEVAKATKSIGNPAAPPGTAVTAATAGAAAPPKPAPAGTTSRPAAPAPAPAGTSSRPAAPAAVPAPIGSTSRPAAAAAEGPLSQDDIDKLLSDLGASKGTASLGAKKADAPAAAAVTADAPPRRTVPPAPEPVAAVPPKPADATAELSPEEIDAIVAKQNEAPPGHDSEAVIAQSDIDALVKQLATATGAPEGQEVAAAIADRAADIDAMQAGAATPSPDMTRDAVDVNSVLGRTGSTASLAAPHAPAATTTVAAIATVEWRGAKALLWAAVIFLAFSAGGVVFLTVNVHQLYRELRAGREAEHPAVEGYADRLRLALAKLDEPDEAERARGVRWLDELKREHPERAAEVGVALARYFHAREAWRRAADEYAAAIELAGGGDDPRILLEQADCQTRLGDDAGAIRTVYALLAAEARWTSDRDAAGRPVAQADRERNRQAVADAYLVLGRLLARAGEGASAQAEPAPAATHGEPHGEHP